MTDRILVVDDDAEIRQLLELLLQKNGYESAPASDAGDARRLLREGRYALALVDVSMPHESGIELLTHIVIEYPSTAVVMVTGLDDMEFGKNALDIGACGYVIKPFRARDLLARVAEALDKRKPQVAVPAP